MWNLKDINAKKNYVTERLKNCSEPKEKETLALTMLSYLAMLDNSGSWRYTGLYNTMDRLTQNKFSDIREQENAQLEQDIFFKDGAAMNDEYLKFLLDICNHIAETPYVDFDDNTISSFVTNYEDILSMSHNFYRDLGDQEILEQAERLFNDESCINISKLARRGMSDCNGLTFNDYLYGKSYINLTRKNNLFDFQVLNHEIMHGVDFYMQKKLPSENYYGFHEVPTYTIDYLFIDYLDSKQLDRNEIQKLKMQKDNYLQELAKLTRTQIKGALIRNKKYQNASLDDIREVLYPQLIKQLLELQSGIVAYGIYNQIKIDKAQGLSNLKKFMQSILPKTQTPDFSFIGLDNQTLLELSKQIGTYSMSNNTVLRDDQGIKR